MIFLTPTHILTVPVGSVHLAPRPIVRVSVHSVISHPHKLPNFNSASWVSIGISPNYTNYNSACWPNISCTQTYYCKFATSEYKGACSCVAKVYSCLMVPDYLAVLHPKSVGDMDMSGAA